MDLLLKVEADEEKTMHRTVVPLFTGVPGTVRVDCIVPEPDIKTEVISPVLDLNNDRVRGCQSINTSHVIIIPVPALVGRSPHNGTEHLYQLAQTLTLDPL